ncbi:uncharacterized protein LKV04_002712 [Tautogolabrus adspersus]
MAKRRAEDTLLHDSPSKRCYRSLCSVDMQIGGVVPSGGVSPHYFEDVTLGSTLLKFCLRCRLLEVSRSVTTPAHEQTPKKRAREDSTGPETALPKSNNEADEDTNAEDCTFNSFQYWRVPLPELDLSLLEDNNDHTQTQNKSKEKYSSSDAMET